MKQATKSVLTITVNLISRNVGKILALTALTAVVGPLLYAARSLNII